MRSTEATPLPLTAAAVLTAWETGRQALASIRALTLLRAALPEGEEDEAANWCIGEGDAFLFRLRRSMFGPRLECMASCPACASELELALEVENLLTTHGFGAAKYQVPLGTPPVVIFFRLPNRADLQALPWPLDAATMSRLLVERCVLYVEHEGEKISSAPLSEQTIAAVSEAMAREDPQAEILLSIVCPNCDHTWQTAFDIVDFLWREISGRAWRLLTEIHQLAQAYGWTESEILALSEARRQTYLELINS